jgi:hypothetical protein
MEFIKWLISMLNVLYGYLKPKPCEIPLMASEGRVKTEFIRIHDTLYDERTNNCKDKSEAFADFLILNLAVNVDTLQVYFKDQTYTHQFIIWNNLVYDPTAQDIVFGMDLTKYIDFLYSIGFTGMRIRSPYIRK